MKNVFLAYNYRDIEKLNNITKNLNSLSNSCMLQYYKPNIQDKFNTKDFLYSLHNVYLFVVLISDNSLNSNSVQLEILEAIRLFELGQIKRICPIIIDESINNSDSRIPEYIKRNIYRASSLVHAAQIIEEVVDYELSKT